MGSRLHSAVAPPQTWEGGSPLAAFYCLPTAGRPLLTAFFWPPSNGDHWPGIASRPLLAACTHYLASYPWPLLLAAKDRPLATSCPLLAAPPILGRFLLAACWSQPTTRRPLSAAHFWPPTRGRLFLPVGRLLLAAHCWPPVGRQILAPRTDRPLPAASYLTVSPFPRGIGGLDLLGVGGDHRAAFGQTLLPHCAHPEMARLSPSAPRRQRAAARCARAGDRGSAPRRAAARSEKGPQGRGVADAGTRRADSRHLILTGAGLASSVEPQQGP